MAFEKQFIFKCLISVESILSDKKELDTAIKSFSKSSKLNRYQLNSKIIYAEHWNENEKILLAAAVFEAIARASIAFFEATDARAHQIKEANQLFLDAYLPLITEDANSPNRLCSVKQNIQRIKKEKYFQDIKPENPYSFFGSVTAVGISLIAAAAVSAVFVSKT